MIKLRNVVASVHRELLPPLTMLGVAAISTITFLSSSAFTLGQVATEVRNSAVKSTIRMSYASQLEPVQAHRLDVARATPVIVDMVGESKAGQVISVTGSHTHSVGVESLRVRSAPSGSSRQIGALAGGANVTVTDERNGWQYVTAGDGTRGWVYHKFLRPVS